MGTNDYGGSPVQPGFSTRIDTPEFRAAMGSSGKVFAITSVLTAVLLAPLLMLVVSFFSKVELADLIIPGIIVEAIALVYVIWSALKRSLGKTWDGEVVKKYVEEKYDSKNDTSEHIYITEMRTDEGKKHKHKEHLLHPVYDYFEVGDRVRYHPKLNFPFEKFDKTRDAYVPCPFCGQRQDVTHDTCQNCKMPLLK